MSIEMMARERASAGAVLLDVIRPGWAERVNLERLNTESPKNCVLGQTFGDFYDAVEDYGIADPRIYGFDESIPVGFRDLDTAWREIVESRREAVPA